MRAARLEHHEERRCDRVGLIALALEQAIHSLGRLCRGGPLERRDPERVAEAAHQRRRLDAVAGDVADCHREPVPVERDRVVPVAPDPRLGARGEVAAGYGEAGDGRKRLREEAALERLGDLVLVLVQARVIDRHRGAIAGELEETDLVRGELALGEAPDGQHADDAPLCDQRHAHHRRDAGVARGGGVQQRVVGVREHDRPCVRGDAAREAGSEPDSEVTPRGLGQPARGAHA